MTGKRFFTPGENLAYIQKWCARRERAPLEVKRKLMSRGMEEDEIEEVIEDLEETGFVDVDRFATAYTRDKYRFNKWGVVKIGMALRQLQIPGESIERAKEEIDPEAYFDNLRSLRAAKMKRLGGDTGREARQKCFQYLRNCGYSSEEIARVDSEREE